MTFPTNQVVSRTGQENKAGDSRTLFLKLFAGEVLTSFKEDNIALNLTRVRTIANGKSAAFPMIGGNTAGYHTPGRLVEANKIGHAERIVTIDDIAVSSVFIADIDEAMTHYEFRSQYTDECGMSLANLVDRNVFRMVAKAAYITNKTQAQAAGLMVLDDETFTKNISIAEVSGENLVKALYKARTLFKKANIKQAPICVLPPENYEELVNVQDTNKVTWMNKDVGGSGSMAEGAIARIAGINLVESNHLPTEDESSGLVSDPEPLADSSVGSGHKTKYRVNGQGLQALIFTPDCVATTKLMDVQTQNVPEPLRLGETMLAKLCVGHDILRPVCAIAVVLAASPAAGVAGDLEVI